MKRDVETEWLTVGVIQAPHGVNGQVRVYPLTDDPQRFHHLTQIRLEAEGKARVLTIEKAVVRNQEVLLKFLGLDNRNDVEGMRGAVLRIAAADRLPLPADHFYIYELIGLEVVTEQGQRLGTLLEVLSPGANDVYVIRGLDEQGKEREILLPATREVVLQVDLVSSKMTVRLLEGLL